ncbi:hypothetical protein [Brevundimonas lutea]|uniref:hypothetical protein n=1 Tax=Brevundimonas lutea TaxID=2293980 RepID=UPI000F032869|nr:hypothetical protein [Brevundimonas lutea]
MSTSPVSNAGPSGDTPSTVSGELEEIQHTLDRVRDGGLGEEVGFEAIARIVRRRRVAAETYQKPWG